MSKILVSAIGELISKWARQTYSKDNSEGERAAYGRCVDELLTEIHLWKAVEGHPFLESMERIRSNWRETCGAWPDEELAVYRTCIADLSEVLSMHENSREEQ